MKKMRFGFRLMTLVLALVVMASCLSAIAEGQENLAFAAYDEVVKVTIGRPTIRPYDTYGIDYHDNLYHEYMMENYNIDADVAWMVDGAAGAYDQKVSLAIASGDLPDIMFVDSLEQIMWMVEADMLEDLTPTYETYAAPYVQDFFSSFGDRAFSTATYDGKIMAMPDLVSGNNHVMLWIREDWLEKVDMPMPKTLDELKNTLTAFVSNKLGGEGTQGLALGADVAGYYGYKGMLDPIFATFDAFPRQWIRGEDGKYTYGSVTQESRAALEVLAQWYEEGILDKQFVSRSNDDLKELLLSGRCGAIYGAWHFGYELSNMLANDPTAKWTCVSVPLNADGEYVALKQDAHVQWVVVRKGYEHPELVWKFASITWQRGADEKLNEITEQDMYSDVDMWPIWRMPKDLNYEDCVVREANEIINALETGDMTGLSIERKNFTETSKLWMENGEVSAWPTYITRVVASSEAGNENVRFADNAYPYPTETMKLAWADMETLENQMWLKIIIGEEEIEYFDTFVDQWMTMGGTQIIEEVNAQLNS